MPYAIPVLLIILIFYFFSPIALLQILTPALLSFAIVAPYTKENIEQKTKDDDIGLYRSSLLLFFNLAFLGSFLSLLGLSYMHGPWGLGANVALFSIVVGILYVAFSFDGYEEKYWKCAHHIEIRALVVSTLTPAMAIPFFLLIYIWHPDFFSL